MVENAMSLAPRRQVSSAVAPPTLPKPSITTVLPARPARAVSAATVTPRPVMNASRGMPSCVVCMTLACSLPGSELKSSGFVPRSVDVRKVLLSTMGRISST